MILELALDSGATLVAYKGGSILWNIAKANWHKSRDFRRLFWTQKRWQQEYADFRERVIKLEMNTGVGLSNDSQEWIESKTKNMRPKSLKRHMQSLANQHNGAVDVVCNQCHKVFIPHNTYSHFYSKTPDNMVPSPLGLIDLRQCLCSTCMSAYKELRKA